MKWTGKEHCGPHRRERNTLGPTHLLPNWYGGTETRVWSWPFTPI